MALIFAAAFTTNELHGDVDLLHFYAIKVEDYT